jgi:hypothetical protein
LAATAACGVLIFFAMRWVLVLSLMLFGLNSFCQIGFNHSYDFGQLAAGFGSLELSGDTVIVYGIAKEDGQSAFGMLFARLDTLGDLIDYKLTYDSLGDDFTLVYPNSFIKLSKGGGYIGVGQLFDREHGYFSKFDNNGNLIRFKEFVDTMYTNNIFHQIIEMDNGYLIGGTNFDWDVNTTNLNIIKVNDESSIIWEKKFQNSQKLSLFGCMLKINGDEFAISSSTTSKPVITPLPQTKNTSKIFAIDSLGNVKWQWESQP